MPSILGSSTSSLIALRPVHILKSFWAARTVEGGSLIFHDDISDAF